MEMHQNAVHPILVVLTFNFILGQYGHDLENLIQTLGSYHGLCGCSHLYIIVTVVQLDPCLFGLCVD